MHTHTPDENQLTAWPASSDVPTPVPFINVQPKAAGLGPTVSPTRLNSTPTKQTQRDRQRDTHMQTFKQSKDYYLREYVNAAGKTIARQQEKDEDEGKQKTASSVCRRLASTAIALVWRSAGNFGLASPV